MNAQTRSRPVLTALAAAAVAAAMSTALPALAQTVKIGTTGALTGPYNEFGEGVRRGALLAIERWNAKGGVLGRQIELAMALDDQLVPDRAVQNLRRILDTPDIDVIIGPGGSGPTLAVIDMATVDGRPYCNPQAQTPSIVYPDGLDKPARKNVISTAIQNDVEAKALGNYVAPRFKKIGIMHESTGYGVSGAQLLSAQVEQATKGKPVAVEAYNQRAQDMTAQISRVQRAGADVLVVIGLGADMAVVRRNMLRLGFDVPLITSGGGISLPYKEGAGELAVGTRATMVGTYTPGTAPKGIAKDLSDAYAAKFGKDRWWGDDPTSPQVYFALTVGAGFDCASMLLEGVRRAGATDKAKVVDALNGLTGYAVSNGTANFSPTQHNLLTPEQIAVFEYVKGEKGQVALRLTKQ
ncbi:amino acid-binding protein [Vineibacter terrae]|uniref:Amino acid-binding protein n=1 Tax=Vineibacter terrae TaxID=2586908 RepID=A0A5C8PKU1_9HYPH|nr:ABC transporter substrate-binding protein [Vineibacter terrae]TXL74324.1 amino acid-binding protein [Vineibacter terrae]